MFVISLAGLIVGILVFAGVPLQVTFPQATILVSVCSLTLVVTALFLTIHYKVDDEHVRLNIAFVDMLSGRIRVDKILNVVLDKGKLYISYLWRGADPVIALISISPKRYEKFKDLLIKRNPNIVFYESKDETTDSEQQ